MQNIGWVDGVPVCAYSVLGSIILSVNNKENRSSCLSSKMSTHINKRKLIRKSCFCLKNLTKERKQRTLFLTGHCSGEPWKG